jgi:hypothetical protein
MRGKFLLVVGLAVGYVLGARAGRQRYELIKRTAKKIWHNPQVQKQVGHVEDFAKDKASDVADLLSDGAKKAAAQMSGRSKTSASSRTGEE